MRLAWDLHIDEDEIWDWPLDKFARWGGFLNLVNTTKSR